MVMRIKDIHKISLLEYFSNPANKWPNRSQMAKKVLGYKQTQSMYRIFTVDELAEIEKEGLKLRRQKYCGELAEIDKVMIREAKDGNVPAGRLCYERFEDWTPRKVQDSNVSVHIMSEVVAALAECEQEEDVIEGEIVPKRRKSSLTIIDPSNNGIGGH